MPPSHFKKYWLVRKRGRLSIYYVKNVGFPRLMDSMMKGELEPDFHRQTNYFVKPNVWIPLYIRVGNILCNIIRELFETEVLFVIKNIEKYGFRIRVGLHMNLSKFYDQSLLFRISNFVIAVECRIF